MASWMEIIQKSLQVYLSGQVCVCVCVCLIYIYIYIYVCVCVCMCVGGLYVLQCSIPPPYMPPAQIAPQSACAGPSKNSRGRDSYACVWRCGRVGVHGFGRMCMCAWVIANERVVRVCVYFLMSPSIFKFLFFFPYFRPLYITSRTMCSKTTSRY